MTATARDRIDSQAPLMFALMACQPFDVDIRLDVDVRLTGGNACAAIVIADPRNDRWEVLLTNGDADLPVQVDGQVPTVLVALLVDGEDAAHRTLDAPVAVKFQGVATAVAELLADAPKPTGHLQD